MFLKMSKIKIVMLIVLLLICHLFASAQEVKSFSGIYPHLAFYNNEDECGTGAVVPWADRLWAITYGPHFPYGSSDKLYEINSSLQETIRPESVGGTPSNRMIHKESNQLFIGPYAIDSARNVRVIPYSTMPGRHTGNARHLTDPANKIYYGTMEEGFYEVDVNTLGVKTLYKDANVSGNGSLLPGAHGKGLYSGQGAMYFVNNGAGNNSAGDWRFSRVEQYKLENCKLCPIW